MTINLPKIKRLIIIIQCWREWEYSSTLKKNMPGMSGNHSVIREEFSVICQKLKSHSLNPLNPVYSIYYRNIHIHFQEVFCNIICYK